MKFCPRCGATDKDFYRGFCIDCYKEMNVFAKFPKKITITRCKKCGFWQHKQAWVEDNYDNILKVISGMVDTTLFAPAFDVTLRENKILIAVRGFVDERKTASLQLQEEVPIVFEERTCDSCLKYNRKNYEFKIQLRRDQPFDAIKYKRIENFIMTEVDYLSSKDERARSFWVEDKKEGLDFLFGFKQIGDSVLKRVFARFKTKHEISSELVGLDKHGKSKFRVTNCIRI